MARCEVCGHEQYPANTVVRYDEAHNRHFFCSGQHAKAWEVEKEQVTEAIEAHLTYEVALTPRKESSEEKKTLDEALQDEEVDLFCSECGFSAKSEAGLSAHIRAKHKQ